MMIDKLEQIAERTNELEKQIADPDAMKDMNRYKDILREHSHLRETTDEYYKYKKVLKELEEAQTLVADESDDEMRAMAEEELTGLEESKEEIEDRLKILLIPKDPLDLKNIIVEIRAGTGGDEAALFAANLYRMYTRYADMKGWQVEIMDMSETGIGGFKEVVFSVAGKNVYEHMRYESGVHRVQRVPETESSGRIHTSAVTVAVLPEAEDTDIQVNAEDLKIDVYRSSGPGGQSVNTTDSAVRITHIPTGLVVTCQDEKSQHKNKAKALRVLRARLFEQEENRIHQERAEARRTQIGSGDRSERIRTYNFPQNRLTDHRINFTLYKLEAVMEGDLDETIDAMKVSVRDQLLGSIAE